MERHADLVLRPDVLLAGTTLTALMKLSSAPLPRSALPRIEKMLGQKQEPRGSPSPARREIKVTYGSRRRPMTRISIWLAALTIPLLLWHECGEILAFLLPYRTGCFPSLRRGARSLPVRDALHPFAARNNTECSTPSFTSSTHSLTRRTPGTNPRWALRSFAQSFYMRLVSSVAFPSGDSLLVTQAFFRGSYPLRWLLIP